MAINTTAQDRRTISMTDNLDEFPDKYHVSERPVAGGINTTPGSDQLTQMVNQTGFIDDDTYNNLGERPK